MVASSRTTWSCKEITICHTCNCFVHDNQLSIFCDLCKTWIHSKCIKLTRKALLDLSLHEEPWFCSKCIGNTFPFSPQSRSQLNSLFNQCPQEYKQTKTTQLQITDKPIPVLNINSCPGQLKISFGQVSESTTYFGCKHVQNYEISHYNRGKSQ